MQEESLCESYSTRRQDEGILVSARLGQLTSVPFLTKSLPWRCNSPDFPHRQKNDLRTLAHCSAIIRRTVSCRLMRPKVISRLKGEPMLNADDISRSGRK